MNRRAPTDVHTAMTPSLTIDRIQRLCATRDACKPALRWLAERPKGESLADAWRACPEGPWHAWLLAELYSKGLTTRAVLALAAEAAAVVACGTSLCTNLNLDGVRLLGEFTPDVQRWHRANSVADPRSFSTRAQINVALIAHGLCPENAVRSAVSYASVVVGSAATADAIVQRVPWETVAGHLAAP